MAKTITYNSNDLQTTAIITEDIDYDGGAKRNVSLQAIANANKSKATNSDAPSKSIIVSGTLFATSPSALDDLVDTFKGYFGGLEKNLDIGHGSGIRRFIATPHEPIIKRKNGTNWATFTIQFDCSSAYGSDTTTTSLATGTGVTTSTANWAINCGGSAEYQYPVITVTLSSGTQLTNQTIYIGNNSNGQVCTIKRNWVASDVLVVDAANQIVTVNGVEVEFSGSIPIFDKGAGAVTYADTFLTRSVNYSIIHTRQWA